MLDYKACQLCPRRCNVDRTAGQLGFCHMPARFMPLAPRPTIGRSR